MNQNTQHCFLLDGKIIHPINSNNQKLFFPLKNEISSTKFNISKDSYSNQQINNTETYLITRIIPSINSSQMINRQSYKSPSTINIIIKPFIPSKNYHKHRKNLLHKHKKSSLSLKNTIKPISTFLSGQISSKHRLSTFKDITRPIILNKTTSSINHNENFSSNILNSRTLINIYRNKKQELI